LIAFKYFDFFLESFHQLFASDSIATGYSIWNTVIPVGLSFYTFQTMSYTIDVFRKNTKPSDNIINFACFVSFFPQLVAGPIERARALLPQFESVRSFDFDNAKEGLRQILWGLFKKVLVADKLGLAVSMVFDRPEAYGTGMLWYASLLFFFQIYCDFSGYTDIAIGTAKLFGFKLSKNFRIPYLSVSIHEFWSRWHITLTRWFTDYVYLPIIKLGKRLHASLRTPAILLTMFLVGLWHGANWNFVAFGLINGFILVIEQIPLFKRKVTLHKWLYGIPRLFSLGYFLAIAAVMSMFFRASGIEQAFFMFKRMFSFVIDDHISSLIGIKLVYLVVLIMAELLTRRLDFPLQNFQLKVPRPLRWAVYYTIIFLIIRYAEPREAFIYFQF
jgi:D-alanyl-lipoteichoic acid acyltransferase DltB (MBOAT superfamily)